MSKLPAPLRFKRSIWMTLPPDWLVLSLRFAASMLPLAPPVVVTGADGYVPEDELDYKSMPIGSYVAVEVGSPEGHLMNPDSKQAFYWDGKRHIQLVFQNDSKVSVQLQKVGENDAPLADAIFDVYKDGQLIGSQATDAAGTITIDNISEGFYSFTEKRLLRDTQNSQTLLAFMLTKQTSRAMRPSLPLPRTSRVRL